MKCNHKYVHYLHFIFECSFFQRRCEFDSIGSTQFKSSFNFRFRWAGCNIQYCEIGKKHRFWYLFSYMRLGWPGSRIWAGIFIKTFFFTCGSIYIYSSRRLYSTFWAVILVFDSWFLILFFSDIEPCIFVEIFFSCKVTRLDFFFFFERAKRLSVKGISLD